MLRNLVVAMAMVLAMIGGVAYSGDATALDGCEGSLCDVFEVDPCGDPNATLNWKQCGEETGSTIEVDSPDRSALGDPDAEPSGPRPGSGPDDCFPRCLNWKLVYVAPPITETGGSR